MKRFSLVFFSLLFFIQCKTPESSISQNEVQTNEKSDSLSVRSQPKLVVGIVVDQMRYDYITRFWNRFGDEGFKRLIAEGYLCKNNHFNYAPTFTGPGHASVYTGTTPKNHAIISNDWYDKFEKDYVYCAQDNTVECVGTSSNAGKMSPRRMKATSVADQNRLNTQFKGKTIGVALKDRGSILPAGHTANAAYWFDGADNGKWITSTYYLEELPQWVMDFNSSGKTESYFKTWNTLEAINTYTESGKDLNDYEEGFKGKPEATFPYDLNELRHQNGNYSIIKSTPFGNNLTTDFALAAVKGEALGADEITDFLTLSYSSTDYVGHNFGVNSKELEDTYLRLDQDLTRLLKELDEYVGEGQYTVFLTADHGAMNEPEYLQSKNIPAGYFDSPKLAEDVKDYLGKEYGVTDLVENISSNQVFFDYEKLKEENITTLDLQNNLKDYLLNYPNIDKVFTRQTLESANYNSGIESLIQNGYHQERSGDIAYVLDPGYILSSVHGSAYTYDTHVPLIFFGQGINNGQTTEKTEITDIAPTISALLGISFPNGATGKVLHKVIDQED